MPNEEYEKPVFIKEAAEICGVSEEKLRRGLFKKPDRHPLPHLRLGETGRHVKVYVSDCRKWLHEETQINAYGKVLGK